MLDLDAHGPRGTYGTLGSAPSPLTQLEYLIQSFAGRQPELRDACEEMLALVAAARRAGPSRDEIAEAIETVCGDELGGGCISRIADAVMRLNRGR